MTPDRAVADELCTFIDASPSPYHAVEAAVALLSAAGYEQVSIGRPFPAGAGRRYVRRGGSLIAWHTPVDAPTGVKLIGAHTDSPNLRVKPNPDHTTVGIRQVGVEVYGGALVNSWLDRDLGLSGRVTVRTDHGPSVRLIRVDEPLLRVPQLAIHLDRDIVTDGLKLNPQQHLAPIWDLDGEAGSGQSFVERIATLVGAGVDDLLGWDLMTHDLTPARRTGADGVFVSAPRLDNLCSSFTALRALVATEPTGSTVPVVCLYDHEEIGSSSATGADSTLLSNTLERIFLAADAGRDAFLAAMASSHCLSADMAHGTHPNYVDRHEPDHRIALNGGVVIKVNANQRYATDAESVGMFAQVCLDADVPLQRFVTRTDLPCGSTIGPITSARLGMATVDVGIAQLAMHSSRELCGADDPAHYLRAMSAFLAD